MICYVDTSVLVALFVRESRSADIVDWYEKCADELLSSAWCVTEFASALGLKQRNRQITAEHARDAWQKFQSFCANDLRLLPVDSNTFHDAALLTLDAETGLRAGDALHLASALQANAMRMATLDAVFARNAKRLKIAVVM